MNKRAFLLISFLISAVSFGDVLPKKEMNGIKYDSYKNFDKKWKLVTVRFRTDTEELRYTYANSLAYKTLLAGRTDFPDGAVIGKIGVHTEHDPLFESSLVPNGARRYQFMVKNKKKYSKENGWGYALFDERGYPFPEDHQTQVNACAACHNAAEERGYVFSQLVNTKPSKVVKSNFFKMVARDSLPELITNLIPKEFKFVRVLEGTLSKNIFQGTLDEVRPMLSRESFESRHPALLMSEDTRRFSLIVPENLGAFCNGHGKNGIFMKSILTNLQKDDSKSELSYCYTP